MSTKPLLIELFTEELPPKALKKLGDAFAQGVEASLKSDGLLAAGSKTESFATPRRLAVRVSGVLAEAPAKAIKEKLMPLAVAKDASGAASPALKRSSRRPVAKRSPRISQTAARLGKSSLLKAMARRSTFTSLAKLRERHSQSVCKTPWITRSRSCRSQK